MSVPLGSYRALDHRFEVSASPAAADVVAAALSPLAAAPGSGSVERIELVDGGDGFCSLRVDGVITGSGESSARVLAMLLEHVNRRAAASATDVVPVHAAAVSPGDGDALLLAGRSGSGKSTLAAASILAGWRFIAEEVAPVDAAGCVRAFPRPIGLRPGGARAIGIEYPDDAWYSEVYPWVPPSDLRRSEGRVVGIVLVDRSVDAHPRPIEPAPALAALVEHMVVPDDRELVAAFRRLEQLVRRVPVVTLGQDDPDVAVAALRDLADGWTS